MATSRRVQIEDACSLQDATVGQCIDRIRDKIAVQLSLARKVQLIDVRSACLCVLVFVINVMFALSVCLYLCVCVLCVCQAITEICQQESDVRWLSREYSEVLAEQEEIRRQYGGSKKALERLVGMVSSCTDASLTHRERERERERERPTLSNMPSV